MISLSNLPFIALTADLILSFGLSELEDFSPDEPFLTNGSNLSFDVHLPLLSLTRAMDNVISLKTNPESYRVLSRNGCGIMMFASAMIICERRHH
jgi:hypothetical protein